jgi:hypothetical protein
LHKSFFALKKIRRVLFYLALSVAVVVVALMVSVFLYKDRLIQQFIREANKQLNTPVNVKRMDVSVFSHFPQVSIVFHDIYVEDSHPFGRVITPSGGLSSKTVRPI